MDIHLPTNFNSLSTQMNKQLFNLIQVDYLIVSLIQTYGWSESQAKCACQRYLNFLYLTWLYPDRLLIPTQEIDCVWHCHILHTRQYRQDCETLFGCYLDHNPDVCSERSYSSIQAAFQQTKILFEKHFGESYWTNDSIVYSQVCSIAGVDFQDPSACGSLR